MVLNDLSSGIFVQEERKNNCHKMASQKSIYLFVWRLKQHEDPGCCDDDPVSLTDLKQLN